MAVAKVSFISPEYDPTTATETIKADFDNIDGRLKPGETVLVQAFDQPKLHPAAP